MILEPLPPMFCAMPMVAPSTWLPSASAAQLLDDLDDLVHAGGAHRMAACFQPAAGGDWDAPIGANLAFNRQARSLPAWGKSGSFQARVRP